MAISGIDCAAAARTGGRKPKAASVIPSRLNTPVKVRFILTTPMVRWAISNSCGMSDQSSRIKAMWAVSMAISRGGVVHTIAHHDDVVSFRLVLFDDLDLVLGQHVRPIGDLQLRP